MKRGYLVALAVLTVLTLFSLALNGIVILGFLQLRQGMHDVVTDARAVITQLAGDTLSYTVELDQDIPLSTEIPFSDTFSVPVNTVVPINTRVVVPVDLGFATYRVTVPIETVFPIDMEVTVPVSQVVDITTIVPLEVEVPVEVAVSETPLAAYLLEVDRGLEQIQEQLERPILQR